MAGLTPLPQTHLHRSTRLTHGQAHDLLQSFLETAANNAAYRPDAILTQHGVQASSVGEGSNLTLNHLGRILKGIKGERVGGVEFNYGGGPTKRRKIEGQNGGLGEMPSSPPVPVRQQQRTQNGYARDGDQVVGVEGVDGEDQAALIGQGTGDWQDKEDYEHAQVDETEDIGGRDTAGEGIEQRGDDMEVANVSGGGRSMAEKEARKQAKKDRWKEKKQAKGTGKKERSGSG